MRRPVTALVVALATSSLVAHAAETPGPAGVSPSPADPVILVHLPTSSWNVVLQGLGELPLKLALPVLNEIQAQAAKQNQAPEAAPDTKPPAKTAPQKKEK